MMPPKFWKRYAVPALIICVVLLGIESIRELRGSVSEATVLSITDVPLVGGGLSDFKTSEPVHFVLFEHARGNAVIICGKASLSDVEKFFQEKNIELNLEYVARKVERPKDSRVKYPDIFPENFAIDDPTAHGVIKDVGIIQFDYRRSDGVFLLQTSRSYRH